ncbi:MAG: helicase, partial [Fuerstiella sp.]
MYLNSGSELVYSPSDLILFVQSPFACWMERLRLVRPDIAVRDEPSEELMLIAKTGELHEAAYLQSLRDANHDICEITGDRHHAGTATLQAISDQREIIFQSYLSLPPFAGYADFLVREAGNDTRYEIWDTKLARKPKPYYLIQLCCYAEMLEKVQGSRPDTLRVVLGTNQIASFRTDDFYFYYRHLKAAFLDLMDQFDPDADAPAPDPRGKHGSW